QRRSAIVNRIRRQCSECVRLQVHDTVYRTARHAAGVKEIPLEQISSTVEPARARQFDADFRPSGKRTRARWERLWMAEQRGEGIPPISFVRTRTGHAAGDRHHRASV